jgi:hypothetical protein
MRLGRYRLLTALCAALAVLSWARGAAAQLPGDDAGGLGDPSGQLPQASGAANKGPETHAASGGETPAQLPTEAAQIPERPNEIPRQLRSKLGSDYDPLMHEHSRGRETTHRFYGPYYEEESGDYRFRTIFPPLWLERKQGDDYAALYGLSYFQRRSPEVDVDVFFPLFWKLRHGQTYTTIVGPVMHRESPVGHDNWFAPLYFEGSGDDGLEYLHLPPLLVHHHRDARGGFSMVGPAFCKWKGGARCDSRTADEIVYGVAPFYIYGRDDESEWEVLPPLLHYYRYRERGDEELNVWGPLWLEKSRDGGVVNVLPVVWHNWGENEAHTTIFPLFHYGYSGAKARLIATPLFVDRIDDEGAHTFATYIYARHRGRTELDMVTPLFWYYRDPDIDLHRVLALPFVYYNTSPRSDDIAVFPFFAKFHRHNIYNETWVTPLFRHRTDLTGWETDIFPFFYMGRENHSTHLVVAPILWDFASPKSRQTVVFPLYWRFADEESLSQLVGNTYYYEEKRSNGKAWEFHFFPLFSYGETPDGHWWNILYGLAGYTREGTMAKMRLSYIPIPLSD